MSEDLQKNKTNEKPADEDNKQTDTDNIIPIAQPEKPSYYLAIAIGFFILAIILLVGLIFYKDKFDLILGDRAYYFLLFPLSFSAAAFLFGVMNSYAKYNHKTINGGLQLGGPVVIAVLVIVGGFKLHGETSFYYTVNVNSDSILTVSPNYPKPQNMAMSIQEDDDWKPGNLNSNGDFDFKKIEGKYKNGPVHVKFTSKFWKAGKDSITLTNSSQTLFLEPDGSLSEVSGIVKDSKGIAVPGAIVSCQGISTKSLGGGSYTINIPLAKQSQTYQVSASYDHHSGLAQAEPATHVSVVIFLYDYIYR
jgi:hypothetical protein